MQGLSGDDVGAFGRITFYPMQTRAFRSPLVRLPEDDIAFPFNIVRIPGAIGAEKDRADGRAKPRAVRADPQGRRRPVSGQRVSDVIGGLEAAFWIAMAAAQPRRSGATIRTMC